MITPITNREGSTAYNLVELDFSEAGEHHVIMSDGMASVLVDWYAEKTSGAGDLTVTVYKNLAATRDPEAFGWEEVATGLSGSIKEHCCGVKVTYTASGALTAKAHALATR